MSLEQKKNIKAALRASSSPKGVCFLELVVYTTIKIINFDLLTDLF